MAGAAAAFSPHLHSRHFSRKKPICRSCSSGEIDGSLSERKLHKWRMVIAYDGTRFSGWQYQESIPTVQCIIEKALMRITSLSRKEICLVGASRTDTGVHAWGQVAHFTTPDFYDLDNFHSAINGVLPDDIRVREMSSAGLQFHARFSTLSKIYHYKIYNEPVMDPFQFRYACHSAYKLDASLMREAANYFVGKHDFSSFANTSRNDRVINPVKEIFRFDVVEMGPILQLEVEGSGFLFRQVRNMASLLMQVGKEAHPPDVVPMILEVKDRRVLARCALLAPPQGLCLMSVKYKECAMEQLSTSASFGRARTISTCKLPFY